MLPLTGLNEPYCYSLKKIVRVNKSKESEIRENILLLARDRNGERVNECDNRQSCLLFPKWSRLSSLSSPLLTWQQFLKKEKRASEKNSREVEGGEKVFLGETNSLLTFLHITLVAHKHKLRNLNWKTLILYCGCDCDLQCIPYQRHG